MSIPENCSLRNHMDHPQIPTAEEGVGLGTPCSLFPFLKGCEQDWGEEKSQKVPERGAETSREGRKGSRRAPEFPGGQLGSRLHPSAQRAQVLGWRLASNDGEDPLIAGIATRMVPGLLSGRGRERDRPKPSWKGSASSDLMNCLPQGEGFLHRKS